MPKTTVLADGIFFGEGPRWHGGKLWFSDFYETAVKTCTEDGKIQIEFTTAVRPSGLGWMPDGSLLVVQMQDRKLQRRGADGVLRDHADLSGLAAWYCNDMVVDATGRAYVGNFGFNLEEAFHTRPVEDILANHPTANLMIVEPDGRECACGGSPPPGEWRVSPSGRPFPAFASRSRWRPASGPRAIRRVQHTPVLWRLQSIVAENLRRTGL